VPELDQVVGQCDYVFHLAAQVGNIRSIEAPETDAQTNILASVRLLSACRTGHVRKIVYSSSSAIFGDAVRLPIDEDHPQRPQSFYGLSKLTAEKYALMAAALWQLPTVCLRYFNVYGLPMERSEYAGVISIFLDRLREGRQLIIYGDGRQARDFVYIDDVVQGNMLAALRGAPGTVYNIGTGRPTTVAQLAQVLIDVTGIKSDIVYQPARAGEVRDSLADISRARRDLGFEPQYDLQRGLAAIWTRLVDTSVEETR